MPHRCYWLRTECSPICQQNHFLSNRGSVDHDSDIALTSGLYFRPTLNRKAVALDESRQTIYKVHINLDGRGHEHARMDRGRN
jgi:hypothetical protein